MLSAPPTAPAFGAVSDLCLDWSVEILPRKQRPRSLQRRGGSVRVQAMIGRIRKHSPTISGAPSRWRGVAAVEAAVLLPLALLLTLGTWEVGRMVEVSQILNNAAREGGRAASTGQNTNSQVQQTVSNYLKNAGLPYASATVTVTNLTHGGTDCTAATELDQLQVSITLPFTSVRWSAATLVTNSSTQLRATAIYYSNNGASYPSSITVPQGY